MIDKKWEITMRTEVKSTRNFLSSEVFCIKSSLIHFHLKKETIFSI